MKLSDIDAQARLAEINAQLDEIRKAAKDTGRYPKMLYDWLLAQRETLMTGESEQASDN